MKICLRLFAFAKQAAGSDTLEFDLPEGADFGRLRRELAERVPELAAGIDQMMFAVDTEYATDATPIRANAEIACIPPVSGG